MLQSLGGLGELETFIRDDPRKITGELFIRWEWDIHTHELSKVREVCTGHSLQWCYQLDIPDYRGTVQDNLVYSTLKQFILDKKSMLVLRS